MENLTLFIVSDSTGETAEHLARSAVSQFGAAGLKIVRHRYMDAPGKMNEIISRASAVPSIVVCTLADRRARSDLEEKTTSLGIPFVDLMGPMIDALEHGLGRKALETPGLYRKLDEDYFKKIKAVEFAIQCDDGKGGSYIKESDLLILGVSRTGKTPLSMYIANKGFKVANIPLIPEVEPPEVIKSIPSSRIVGLVISAEKLIQIRQERLRLLGLEPSASAYASPERVRRELMDATKYLQSLRARICDVTDKAVEEVAQEILDSLQGTD